MRLIYDAKFRGDLKPDFVHIFRGAEATPHCLGPLALGGL